MGTIADRLKAAQAAQSVTAQVAQQFGGGQAALPQQLALQPSGYSSYSSYDGSIGQGPNPTPTGQGTGTPVFLSVAQGGQLRPNTPFSPSPWGGGGALSPPQGPYGPYGSAQQGGAQAFQPGGLQPSRLQGPSVPAAPVSTDPFNPVEPMHRRILQKCREMVVAQGWDHFYPPMRLAQRAQELFNQINFDVIAQALSLADGVVTSEIREVIADLVPLGLCHHVILADDSGSMSTATSRTSTRWADMGQLFEEQCDTIMLFDAIGIDIHFLNSEEQSRYGIGSTEEIKVIFSNHSPDGLTPLATALYNMINRPYSARHPHDGLLQRLSRRCNNPSENLDVPIMVHIETDGEPLGESAPLIRTLNAKNDHDLLRAVIKDTEDKLAKAQLPGDSLIYSISQIGDDSNATAFLERTEACPEVGDVFHTVKQDYNAQNAEYRLKYNGAELPKSMYVIERLDGVLYKKVRRLQASGQLDQLLLAQQWPGRQASPGQYGAGGSSAPFGVASSGGGLYGQPGNGTGLQTQGYTPQGMQSQGYAPQGMQSQGYAPQGMQSQGYAPQGMQGQGYAPQGMQGQGYAPQGMQGQGYAPQGMQGQGYAPQGSGGQGGSYYGQPYQ